MKTEIVKNNEDMKEQAILELREFQIVSNDEFKSLDENGKTLVDSHIIRATNFVKHGFPIYISVINGILQVSGDYGEFTLYGHRNLRSYSSMSFSKFWRYARGEQPFKEYNQDLFFSEIEAAIKDRLESHNLDKDEIETYRGVLEYTEGIEIDDDNEISMDSCFPEDEHTATVWLREIAENVTGSDCWWEFISNCTYPSYRAFYLWQMINKVDQLLYPDDYEEVEGVLTQKKDTKS